MFDNSGDDTNAKPGIEEQYLTSAGSSNLRVGNDSNIRTPGDMIAAAGMNRHRTGLAILRLRTEWDKSAKPVPMTPAQIEQLAAKLEIEPAKIRVPVPMTPEQIAQAVTDLAIDPAKLKAMVWTAEIVVPNPHAGLVRTADGDGKVQYRLPLVVAKERAQDWYEHELMELLTGLRSLPPVRDGLVHWLAVPDAGHIVAPVLLWWLDPKCRTCGGSAVRIVKGSGGRSSGKPCGDCKGRSLVAGERKLPHGGLGRRVLSRVNDCLRAAKVDLGEGAFRNKRSEKNEHQRETGT
jgi:hypothetical protein